MIALTAFVLLMSSGPTGAAPACFCPPDHEPHREAAVWFASSPDYAEHRAEVPMAPVDSAAVRPLSDAAGDAAVCQRLGAIVAPGGEVGPSQRGPFAFYKAGDYYLLVAAALDEPGYHTLGYTRVVVLDAQFRQLRSFLL